MEKSSRRWPPGKPRPPKIYAPALSLKAAKPKITPRVTAATPNFRRTLRLGAATHGEFRISIGSVLERNNAKAQHSRQAPPECRAAIAPASVAWVVRPLSSRPFSIDKPNKTTNHRQLIQ